MICTRCQQEIRAGDPHVKHDIHSASGPGATVYQHVVCPKPDSR